MNCPKCSNSAAIKSGKIKGKQRYKCKKCNYHYTVQQKSTAKPKELKKYALQLYLEGLGFRSIGRILNVSNVSVLNWIRGFGQEVQSLSNNGSEVDFVELDEMHSYIGNKKTIVGFGLLLIDMRKSSSISLLATEALRQQKSSGG
jgi:transposase-like protein